MKTQYEIDGQTIHKYILEPIKSNMYLIMGNQDAVMIDPIICEEAKTLLLENDVRKLTILLTHEHYDHISGVNFWRENFECHVIGNRYTKEAVKDPEKNFAAYWMYLWEDKGSTAQEAAGQSFDETYSCECEVGFSEEYDFMWNGILFWLMETPGHSRGSICITMDDAYVFTGDSLVDGNKVITRFPGGSRKRYNQITKPFLESLPDDTVIFPGHGQEGVKGNFLTD